MKRKYILYLLLWGMMLLHAENYRMLSLPDYGQLSSDCILCIKEDSEGFLWYATEGGGVCRSDGLHVDIFRSDTKCPDLLGHNSVACLEEFGNQIILGTFRGAYLLNKEDYSVSLMEEVDKKRINDILVDSKGALWISSNRKIFHYSEEGKFISVYRSVWRGEEKYVNSLYEDSEGRIWASQWDGGLICKQKAEKSFEEMEWPLPVAPSAIVGDSETEALWIGTVGNGVVRYWPDDGKVEQQSQSGTTICIDILLSADGSSLWMTTTDDLFLFQIDKQLIRKETSDFVPQGTKVFNQLSLDRRGQLLVAGSMPCSFVLTSHTNEPWFRDYVCDGLSRWSYRERNGIIVSDVVEHVVSSPKGMFIPVMNKCEGMEGIWATDGEYLMRCTKDSVWVVSQLSVRPSAMVDDGRGNVWLATGKGLMRYLIFEDRMVTETIEAKEVSALAFTPDGVLWLATIYGEIYSYIDGKLTMDNYATNKQGDAVTALAADSLGNLVIVYEHYTRLYSPEKQTLRQQSTPTQGVYSIELQETPPGHYWSQPERGIVVERLPEWMTSWWMILIVLLFCLALVGVIVHNVLLRRQRARFLTQMKSIAPPNDEEIPLLTETKTPEVEDEWLKKVISLVQNNIADEQYGVERLSNDLCMARMTFYRKIQAHTGQKPTEFIRTIRLRRAAELLCEGKQTVTEVAYATGFSSVSYFSRCFRAMFGVSPTQFMAKEKIS